MAAVEGLDRERGTVQTAGGQGAGHLFSVDTVPRLRGGLAGR